MKNLLFDREGDIVEGRLRRGEMFPAARIDRAKYLRVRKSARRGTCLDALHNWQKATQNCLTRRHDKETRQI